MTESAVNQYLRASVSGPVRGSIRNGFQSSLRRADMKILMVLTSHDTLSNTGRKTAFWLEEFCGSVFRVSGRRR